jgi:hypothetical protein
MAGREMAVTEVYPLRLTRKDFDRAPEQERLVYLVLGQVANDINLLRKQLIFATGKEASLNNMPLLRRRC